MIREKKMSYTWREMFHGFPIEFALMFKYIRSIDFEMTPDYKYIHSLVLQISTNADFKFDNKFDWLEKAKVIPQRKI
jgi:hypothetical protein